MISHPCPLAASQPLSFGFFQLLTLTQLNLMPEYLSQPEHCKKRPPPLPSVFHVKMRLLLLNTWLICIQADKREVCVWSADIPDLPPHVCILLIYQALWILQGGN